MIPDIFEYSGVLSGCAVTEVDGTTVRINPGQFVTLHSGDYKIFTLDVARDITISGPDPSGLPIYIGLEINSEGAITHFVEGITPTAAQKIERCYLARVVSWGTGLAVKPHYNNLRQTAMQLKMLTSQTTTIRLELMEGTATIKRLEGKIKGPDVKNVPDTEDKYNTYEISLPELTPANLILRAVDGTNALGTTEFPFPPKTCAIGGTPIDYTGDNWGFFHVSMGLDGSVHLEYPETLIAGTVAQMPSDNYVSRLQREGFVGIIAVHGTAISFGSATAFYGNNGYLEVESPKTEGEILATVLEDGKPMWRRTAALSITSPVKDATVGQLAQYDTTNTVIGINGLPVPLSTVADANKVLTTDGVFPYWGDSPAGQSNVKPSTTGQLAQYDTDTTVSGINGLLVPAPSPQTKGWYLCNNGSIAFWRPGPLSIAPPPFTWQQVVLSTPVPYNLSHITGVATRGAGTQDHFYVMEYYQGSSGTKELKLWKLNTAGNPFVATLAFQVNDNDAGVVESYAAQYYLNKFIVVGLSLTTNCRIEVYDATSYALLYTVPKPAEVINGPKIAIEVLESGSFVITYLIQPYPVPGAFKAAVQHVAFDGTATFTPGPCIVYQITTSLGYTANTNEAGSIEIIPQEGTGLLYLFLRFTSVNPATSSTVLITALHTFDPATPTIAPVVVHAMASIDTSTFVTAGTSPKALVGGSVYFDQTTGTGYVPNADLATPLLAMGLDGSTGLPGFVPYNDLPAGQNLWTGGYNPNNPNEALLLCGSVSDETKMAIYYSTTGGGPNAAWELISDNAGGLANSYSASIISGSCVWVTNDIVVLGGVFRIDFVTATATYCQIGKRVTP